MTKKHQSVKRFLSMFLGLCLTLVVLPVIEAAANATDSATNVAPRPPSVIDNLVPGLNYDQYPSLHELFADYFLIGTAGDAGIVPAFGPPRNTLIGHHFNAFTFENSMKPQFVLTDQALADGARRVDDTINAARAVSPDMTFIGHTIGWHSQTPGSMWDYGNDAEVALQNLYEFTRFVYETWGEDLQAMDVVNEAIGSVPAGDPTNWRQSLVNLNQGWVTALGYEWVEIAFILSAYVVDELGLDVVLYYNDFGLDGLAKATILYEMVKDINQRHEDGLLVHPMTGEPFQRENGRKLIEGIGMQGHYNANTNLDNFAYNVSRFASLGVRISITELDITWLVTDPSGFLTPEQEIAQGQVYAQIFQILMRYAAGEANPYPERRAVERVTFWGTNDGNSWRSSARPLLFNPVNAEGEITAKQALLAVMDPHRFLENHPVIPPEPIVIDGVHSFTLDEDGFTGINIILGNDATTWPYSEAGTDGAVAFVPQPGATYRLFAEYVVRGTFGLEARWLRDNSADNFTAADLALYPELPLLNGHAISGATAQGIPARFNAPTVNSGNAALRAEFTMPADGAPDGLLGNIALRGLNGENEVEFVRVTIHRVEENGQEDTMLVNWPELVPQPPLRGTQGVTVHSPNRGDSFGGANIFVAHERGVWPYGGPSGDGEVAFTPEPGATYRVSFNVTSFGTNGYRVRWMDGNGGNPTADAGIVNDHLVRMSGFGLGVVEPTDETPIATVIPAHFNQGGVQAGTYTLITDITFDPTQGPDGLTGNIQLRGTAGGNSFDVNWVRIERLEAGPRSVVDELLVFYPFGLDNPYPEFTEAFDGNPLVGITAAITHADGTVVTEATPPAGGDTLVANLTGGTGAGGTTGVNLVGNLTYTWLADGVEVQTGPEATFNVLPEHVGSSIQVTVTSNFETGAVTSPETVAVVPGNPETSAPTVTIEGGYGWGHIGNPNYAQFESYEGQTVVIEANVPRGYLFTGWTVEGNVTLHNAAAPRTHFHMGAEDVTIVANFEPITIELVGGYGWGHIGNPNYSSFRGYIGQTVVIQADVPEGQIFSHWTVEAGGIVLHDETAARTHLHVQNLTSANIRIVAHFTADETPVEEVYVVSVTPTAFVNRLNGNQNELVITVTELFSDGTTTVITETFMIRNNASGTFQVGEYLVFVNTQGNTQIREIRIVE